MTPCRLIGGYQRFEGTQCVHHHGRSNVGSSCQTALCHSPENVRRRCNLQLHVTEVTLKCCGSAYGPGTAQN
jgi:hypothetical protein